MKNKKTWIALISVIALVLVVISVTYAYWLVTRTQTNSNVISSACLDITLNGESGDINLTDQFPLSDDDGKKLAPYKFTITNNCNTAVDYHINLESIGDSATAVKASSVKAVLNTNTPKKLYDYVGTETTISGAYEAFILGYGTLSASSTTSTTDSASYELRIWIDADAPISEMNKTYTSKISVSIGQNVSSQGSTLASLVKSAAESTGKLYPMAPTFSSNPADGEYALYMANDDYGTSYYFRGDVENNYVKFGTTSVDLIEEVKLCTGPNGTNCSSTYETVGGCESSIPYGGEGAYCYPVMLAEKGDPLYWRIVRINGDGTVRLIYAGTELKENGTSYTASINPGYYYSGTSYGYGSELKHAGFTYDNNGVQDDNRIKDVIDAWYEANLKDKYDQYIADTIFCNDKEITDDKISTNGYAFMAPYHRIGSNAPILTCKQNADRYTVSESKGNGYLTYPIGLITMDEVLMAGRGTYSYIYSGEKHWTMTPYYYSGYMMMVMVNSSGLFDSYSSPTSSAYIRPVINIKADTLFEGSGTRTAPYELVNS